MATAVYSGVTPPPPTLITEQSGSLIGRIVTPIKNGLMSAAAFLYASTVARVALGVALIFAGFLLAYQGINELISLYKQDKQGQKPAEQKLKAEEEGKGKAEEEGKAEAAIRPPATKPEVSGLVPDASAPAPTDGAKPADGAKPDDGAKPTVPVPPTQIVTPVGLGLNTETAWAVTKAVGGVALATLGIALTVKSVI